MPGRRTSVYLTEETEKFLKTLGISAAKYLNQKAREDMAKWEPEKVIELRIEDLEKELSVQRAKLKRLDQSTLEMFEAGHPRHILDEMFVSYELMVERGGRAQAREVVVGGWREGDRKVLEMSAVDQMKYLEMRFVKKEQRSLVREVGTP